MIVTPVPSMLMILLATSATLELTRSDRSPCTM